MKTTEACFISDANGGNQDVIFVSDEDGESIILRAYDLDENEHVSLSFTDDQIDELIAFLQKTRSGV